MSPQKSSACALLFEISLFSFFVGSDFIHQGIDELVFRNGAEDLSFTEDEAAAFAASDTEIRFSCFARAIHGASHDSDFDGFLKVRDLLFY